ncbi:MAG: hypothetical protein ACUVT1_07570 [Anaerolineae bacterium]
MTPYSTFELGVVALLTILVLDLIGIVGLAVTYGGPAAYLILWAIAGLSGFIAGGILGVFSERRRAVRLALASSIIAALFLLTAIGIAVGLSHLDAVLGGQYLAAAGFQVAGAIAGALAGGTDRKENPPAE